MPTKYAIDVILEPESEPVAPPPPKKLLVQAKVRDAASRAAKKAQKPAYDSDEDEELNYKEKKEHHSHEGDSCCQFQPTSFPTYSSSYRQLDLITVSHEYTINGFSLYRYMGCGMRLCSDLFEAGGQLFRLEVYPGGFNPASSQYLSVFLTSPAPFNPNQIMYEVSIVDQSGEGHFVHKRDLETKRNCGCRNTNCCCQGGHYSSPMMSQGRGIIVSVPKMAKIKDLEAKCHELLPCDTITVRAAVSVIRAGWKSPPAVHNSIPSPLAYQPPFPPPMSMQPVSYTGYVAPSPYIPHPASLMTMPGYHPSPSPPVQLIHSIPAPPIIDPSVQYQQQSVAYHQPAQEYYSSANAQVPPHQPASMSAQDQQYLVYMSTPPPQQ